MLKPICVKCQRFYRPHHTGRRFVEGMPKGGSLSAAPGTSEPEQWQPYKVWSGDEWICHGCGHLIIVGTGFVPMKERHENGFSDFVKEAKYLQVNDC